MSDNESQASRFLGTYFDRDTVIMVSRWADILAWVVVGVYAFDFLLATTVFLLQFARGYMLGMGFTDILTNVVYILERPFRGVVYFIALQGIGKVLLILMDMEENLRRAGRK